MLSEKLKRLLTVVHRWAALALAPVFLLILLSGAVLAFKPITDSNTRSATPVDLAAVVAALTEIDPAQKAIALNVSAGGQTIALKSNDPTMAGTYALATRTLTEPDGFDVFAFTLNVHKNLLIGAGIVVEIASYVMVGILAIGLLLGWPKLRNTLMGWHGGLGWLALPLVALTPVTGAMMALHVGTPALPSIERAAQPLPLARAIEAAAGQVDLSGLTEARRFRQGSVLITATNPNADGPNRYLVSGTGKVTPLVAGPGLVKELHEGTWAGGWSGALNVLAAIALMGLMVTGLYSWLRRARQARRRGGDAAASTLIAYASQTGTAARLAEATAKALREAGEAVVCASLAVLDPRELARFRHNFLIVSTTGEGDVPDPARSFLKRLGATDLRGMRFNLLALGDSRYAKFCGGGQKVRAALLERGASEAAAWQRADGEPTAMWRDWLIGVAGLVGVRLGAVDLPETDRPVILTLIERERLDDPTQDDTRETWRLRFTPDDTALEFRPGDLLLISPVKGQAPRCYSIGGSAWVDSERLDLTVSLHRWQNAAGQERLGLTSTYLCHQLQPGAKIVAQWRRHPGFNPPVDPRRPLILVATGAGIAPFPGFLAERARQQQAGPVWLFFGNRHRNSDYFYRTQFEQWQQQGVLDRLDTAFSRDADDGRYIQDRLMEHGEELLRWLAEDRGALYTCGRAGAAGAAVEQALRELIVRYGSRYGLRPDETLERWRADGTLRFDVFG
ncbi:MAG: PepSY domain-containing protein [Candidatus Competibacteraceae bacterium]|nr:PepSY domain-containing protein [Candidatus Competibacteraceae bacterium]